MLKCNEVFAETEQLLDGDLGLRRRVALRLHLLICSNCRRFVRQFTWLLQAIPYMHRRLTDDDVDKVMTAIDEKRGSEN